CRVRRLQTDDGERIVGRVIAPDRQQKSADDVHRGRREFGHGGNLGITGICESLLVYFLPAGLFELPDFEAELIRRPD
ncbi:hypothetical protein ACC708_36530, partial [Rhizobium ruizarguesonis]